MLVTSSEWSRRDAETTHALVWALLCSPDAGAEALDLLEAGVDEYVHVWAPTLQVRSRFELIASLVGHDDAIGDITVHFAESVGSRHVAIVTWSVTGRFVRPLFIDDDRMVEPTGAIVEVHGATSLGFGGSGRLDWIRCYYDRSSLADQILGTAR